MSLKWFKSRLGKKIIKEDLRRDLEYYLESIESGSINVIPEINGLPDLDTFRSINTDGYTIIAIPVYLTGLGIFQWDPTSVLADNGSTVIRPTVGLAKTGPGRWVIQVIISFAGTPKKGQVLTAIDPSHAGWGGNIDVGGSITNFDNGHTTIDVELPVNVSTPVLSVILPGLNASSIYTATIGCRVIIYTDANHEIAGSIDIVIDVNIVTDGSSVATCTFATTPAPDISRLLPGLAGATATIAASGGGFTISATGPTGIPSHAKARWWTNTFEELI